MEVDSGEGGAAQPQAVAADWGEEVLVGWLMLVSQLGCLSLNSGWPLIHHSWGSRNSGRPGKFHSNNGKRWFATTRSILMAAAGTHHFEPRFNAGFVKEMMAR